MRGRRWTDYRDGWVKMRVNAPQRARFLRLCASCGVCIRNLRELEGDLEMEVSAADYRKLGPARKETGTRCVITEKRGLPFFLFRNRRRKASLLAILLFFCILYGSTKRIWDIRIDGNSRHTEEEILRSLDDCGVACGMRKKSADCQEIAAWLRSQYDDIVWVSARLDGVCLIIDVRESENTGEDDPDADSPCDIVAERDGTVASIVVRRGTAQVRAQDTCKKGEVLVSGTVEITGEDGEAVKTREVAADADITIACTYHYYDRFPLTAVEKIRGRTRRYPWIAFGEQEISLPFSAEETDEVLRTMRRIYLTDSFLLPFSFGVYEVTACQEETASLTPDEVREEAAKRLTAYMADLVGSDMEIVGKEIRTTTGSTHATVRGTIEVLLNNAGRKEKRTAE